MNVLPEIILVVTALILLGLGLRPRCRKNLALLTAAGLALAAGAMLWTDGSIFRLVVVAFSAATLALLPSDHLRRHVGEFFALQLFATVGLILLVTAQDLLTLFLALELSGIPFYALVAFEKRTPSNAEAALKYFLTGAISSAVLLYGLSLIFGVTGSLQLDAIRTAAPDALLLAGVVMAFCGFAFKLAAIPMQVWTPDVYESTSAPVAALLASASKVAGVVVFANFLPIGNPAIQQTVTLAALLSMGFGNLAAIGQSNVRRLLAYSAIAQSGYLLLGIASGNAGAAVGFYAIVYAIAALGAFAVVAAVESRCGGCELTDFNGLLRSSPALAISLALFLASLAGIPPLPGFFGKFALFAAAARTDWMWTPVVVAFLLNAVSLYYYLIVLKHAFAPSGETLRQGRHAPAILAAMLAASLVVAGLLPHLVLSRTTPAVHTVQR